MGEASQHQSYWSQQLYTCLCEMAAQDTNAVLLTLAGTDAVEAGCRYPADGLAFANKCWRAFYHCHEASARPDNEHGHFHIFTDIGGQQWAHVAGLSIDACGQPLHWFTVNRWVTEGPWLDRQQFIYLLQASTTDEQDSLTGRWLFALMQLYQLELIELFHARDRQIQRYARQKDPAGILEDRAIYTLAEKPIELQTRLEKHLLH